MINLISLLPLDFTQWIPSKKSLFRGIKVVIVVVLIYLVSIGKLSITDAKSWGEFIIWILL